MRAPIALAALALLASSGAHADKQPHVIRIATVAPDADGVEGTYVEYIGVNRNARGRGVAKALLHAVFADARDRGRNRVALEVDADSPTKADELYLSLGFHTDYRTESWFDDVRV